MKREPSEPGGEAEWRSTCSAKRATLLGRIQAKDEKQALDRACAEFNIPPADRFRVCVKRMA